MRDRIVVILCALFMIFFIAHQCDKSIQKDRAEQTNEPNEVIHCVSCNKDLTNDYNRINPNGTGYFCTLCYQKTMKGIHDDMRTEGYNTSEYLQEPSDYTGESNYSSNSQINADYSVESDGRVYENDACGLCGGTGIETNHSATFGDQERICPMCEGRGRQSY